MTEPLARIDVSEHTGHPLLRIVGEVDMSNARALGDQLLTQVGAGPTVLLDLTRVDFFDSQGLRMLYRVATTLAAAGTALVIVAPPTGVVGAVLALTAMDKDLDVRPALP